MSTLSTVIIGDKQEVLAQAIMMAQRNRLGGGLVTSYCITKGKLIYTSGNWSIPVRDVITWREIPKLMSTTNALAEMAMNWLNGLSTSELPPIPRCDGSVNHAWKLTGDIYGNITIEPEWTEYHK